MLSGIRAITFDGDQTLWDFFQVMRNALTKTLAELKSRVGDTAADLTVDSLIATRAAIEEGLHQQKATHEEIRRESFRQTLRNIGKDDDGLVDHLTEFYLKQRFAEVLLYPDVISGLESLASDRTLGLISNGNSYPDRVGLADHFDVVIFAQEYGFRKPDLRIFEIAAQQIGHSFDQIMHVGDSLVDDVGGAQKARFTGVWMNRDGALNDTDIVPDYEVDSLLALQKLLEGSA